ncbi:MAG TPA: hypothetical protein PKH94_03640 [Bacteroidales bacterium]|nr:hypothetical protein [Bacteroidales bacterium]HNS46307.1 hypothetical protein [Bacteroidales bacterium]
MTIRLLFILLLSAATGAYAHAQQPQPSPESREKKSVMIDTLDHKLDFSKYLIDMHGFIPWPSIISEPALGDFGLAMALVFISPKESAKAKANYTFPDITGVAGMWTLNNSWGVAALRQGTFPKARMRYRIVGGYAPLNVEFYRTINTKLTGERTKSFLFNLGSAFGIVEASENIWKDKIFLGLNYTFATTKVKYDLQISDTLRRIIEYFQLDTLLEKIDDRSNVGYAGLFAEWDNRNSIFTPDKGIRFRATGTLARNWLGSDDDYQQLEIYTNIFFQPFKPWVCGLMAQWNMMSDDAPFYMLPYLTMRGLPAAKYQGQKILSFETEQRFDFTPRWSVVGFVGTGRTYSTSTYLEDETWHWAGGAGFRYLIARLFKLRMGVDVARGPDQFAYYIVFGHYWDR